MSGEDERQARLSQERHRRTLTQQRRRAKRWLRYNVVARTLCVTAATVGILVLASMSAWYEGRGGGYVAAGAVAAAFAMGAAIAHWRVENRNENVDNLESRILDLEDPTLDIRLRALDEEREDLERRLLDQTLLRNFLTGLVVVDVVAVVSLPFWYGGPGYWGLLAGSLILLAFLQITRDRARELEADRRQTEYEAAVMRSEPEQKPETLFLKHQFEVRSYYDQTLRHGSAVFTLGVVLIGVGVLVVGGAYYVIATDDHATSLNIVIAALSAIGTLFANVVAYQYLKMHAAAVEAVGVFHNRLVEDHDLHFANLLAYEISEDERRVPVVADLARRVVGWRRGRRPEREDAPPD